MVQLGVQRNTLDMLAKENAWSTLIVRPIGECGPEPRKPAWDVILASAKTRPRVVGPAEQVGSSSNQLIGQRIPNEQGPSVRTVSGLFGPWRREVSRPIDPNPMAMKPAQGQSRGSGRP